MKRLLLTLGLVGCGSTPDKPAPDVIQNTPVEGDSAAPDDTAAPEDTADTADSADPIDTGDSGLPTPCTLGLQVRVDDTTISADDTLHVGEAPSRAWDTALTVTLHNPCDDDLRFLGHPDEWLTGSAFSLSTLPPVYLAPGDSADIELAFTPGDTGDYEGALSLPYDQEGSPFTAALSGTATTPLTLVAVGEGRRVSTTRDYGTTWSTDSWDTLDGHTNAMQRGMCYGAGTWVAVGGSDGSYWWTSTDGDTWQAHAEAGGAIGDCDYGDGQFVAFAGDLLTSTDGLSWSVSPQPYTPDHLRAMAHGVDATGTHRWVAVGDNGRVAVTLDGASWSSDANPVSDSIRYVDFGVGTAGPVWVAVGSNGTIATSPDGTSWTEQPVGTRDWSGVVWGGDRFLAGNGITVYSSLDGYAWTLVNSAGVVPLTHLGSMWFAADQSAALYRSDDDGFSWTVLRDSDGGPGYSAARFALETTP